MKWNHLAMKPWLLALPLAFAAGTAAQAAKVYVNVNSPAGSAGNGRSWSTAYDNLESALADPRADSIYIAQGIYTPSAVYSPSGQPGGSSGAASVAGLKTFHIRDGLKLFGGFTGTERDKDDRPMVWRDLLPVTEEGCDASGWLPDPSLTVLDGSASGSFHVVMVGDDVAHTGASVKLSDLTIRGGYAAGTDAGTLNDQSSVTSIVFAHDAGGGLYARYGSVVKLDNVTLADNACEGSLGTVQGPLGRRGFLKEPLLSGGGAIFAADSGTAIEARRCQFTGNRSITFGGGGGAVNMVLDATLKVSQSTFSGNTSGRNGGAIRAKDAGDLNVRGSRFDGNMAVTYTFPGDEGGGAIGCFDGNLFVRDSVFEGNYGQITGGAIFFHAPFDEGQTYVMKVRDSQFTSNFGGPFGGGAITLLAANVHEGSHAVIEGSTFTGNMSGQGGAVYESSLNTVIKRCEFRNNVAAQWGGAVLADNFGDVQFFAPFPIAARKRLVVEDSIMDSNRVVGTLTDLPPFVAVYPRPFDTALNVAAAIASGANTLLGAPNTVKISTAPGTFRLGGGACSALMSGELTVKNSSVVNNSAVRGTGGGFLAGGVNGLVFAPSIPDPFKILDFAAIHIKNTYMSGNTPNDTDVSDIEGVGNTEEEGVFLEVQP